MNDRGNSHGESDRFDGRNEKRENSRNVTVERRSRVLFVRNISFNFPEEKFREMFESYGEIKKIYNQIQQRGIAFITYVSIF